MDRFVLNVLLITCWSLGFQPTFAQVPPIIPTDVQGGNMGYPSSGVAFDEQKSLTSKLKGPPRKSVLRRMLHLKKKWPQDTD